MSPRADGGRLRSGRAAAEVGTRLPLRLRRSTATRADPGLYRLHARDAFRGTRQPDLRQLAEDWNRSQGVAQPRGAAAPGGRCPVDSHDSAARPSSTSGVSDQAAGPLARSRCLNPAYEGASKEPPSRRSRRAFELPQPVSFSGKLKRAVGAKCVVRGRSRGRPGGHRNGGVASSEVRHAEGQHPFGRSRRKSWRGSAAGSASCSAKWFRTTSSNVRIEPRLLRAYRPVLSRLVLERRHRPTPTARLRRTRRPRRMSADRRGRSGNRTSPPGRRYARRPLKSSERVRTLRRVPGPTEDRLSCSHLGGRPRSRRPGTRGER